MANWGVADIDYHLRKRGQKEATPQEIWEVMQVENVGLAVDIIIKNREAKNND